MSPSAITLRSLRLRRTAMDMQASRGNHGSRGRRRPKRVAQSELRDHWKLGAGGGGRTPTPLSRLRILSRPEGVVLEGTNGHN